MVNNKIIAELILNYGGIIDMSKTITIKGKEISEETIIEALKKHCGFTEVESLKAGDVVRGTNGIRIIVKGWNGTVISYKLNGGWQVDELDFDSSYRKIGTLDRIFMQAGINLA